VDDRHIHPVAQRGQIAEQGGAGDAEALLQFDKANAAPGKQQTFDHTETLRLCHFISL
jgi:hypothetical protein